MVIWQSTLYHTSRSELMKPTLLMQSTAFKNTGLISLTSSIFLTNCLYKISVPVLESFRDTSCVTRFKTETQ